MNQAFPAYDEIKARAQVDEAAFRADGLADAYYRLKNLPETHQKLVGTRQEYVALYGIVVRQIAGLDAAAAVARVGRPMYVSHIERTMFELWHVMLAIAYYSAGTVTQSTLIKRYLDHAAFHFAEKSREYLPVIIAHAVAEGADVQAIEAKHQSQIAAWDAAAQSSGFSKLNQPWHPFGGNYAGMQQLHDRLWPQGGAPIFPKGIYGGSRTDWDEMYKLSWNMTSNDVHAGGAGLERFMRLDSPVMIDDSRRFESEGLEVCLCLASSSIAILADRVGLTSEWNRCCGASSNL